MISIAVLINSSCREISKRVALPDARRRIISTLGIVFCALGLAYSLCFLKPSLAIPFLALPLLERATGMANKIKTLVTFAVSQLMLLGATSCMVHTRPSELITAWLRVAAYFRLRGYTVREACEWPPDSALGPWSLGRR